MGGCLSLRHDTERKKPDTYEYDSPYMKFKIKTNS